MSAIDSNTLLDESKCYLCLGVSAAEALKLALLNRIAAGGSVAALELDNLNLDLGQPVSGVLHGLSGTPSNLRLVLVVDVAFSGYAVGWEIDADGCWDTLSGERPFTLSADSTTLNLASNMAYALGNLACNQFGGAGAAVPTSANTHGKLYVWG